MAEQGPAVQDFQTVGVIGAGQMGSGIVQVCAMAGYDVRLQDIGEEPLQRGIENIKRNLDRQVQKGRVEEADRQAAMKRISTNINLESLFDCDLVIEAATENEEIKRAIFQQLCQGLKQDALVCTNTSSISVTRLASVTDRPERFMGMHFMNPVPVMQLVELIRGIATGEETFARIRNMTMRLGKTPAQIVQAAGAPVPMAAAPQPPVAQLGATSAPNPSAEASGAPAPEASPSHLIDVVSPMVGTFYRAPSPEAPSYVEVGTKVGEGATLCIIEAMKLMNELEAELSGTIAEICVDNAEPVEYGQLLFRIDPT